MNIRGFRARFALTALAGSLAVMLVGATAAQADLTRVTGTTTVTPSAAAVQFLTSNGVSVEPTGPATAAGGNFTFPIAAGFGDTQTYEGLLAHAGGLRFSKGDRSAVLRRFVAVRAGDTAVMLAQVPGLRGGCGQVKRALHRYAANHPGVRRKVRWAAWQYPRAARKVVRSLRRYCSDGRVIVLATLTNLGKSVDNGTATLSADLLLAKPAARLLNRLAGRKAVSPGAPLGSAVSTVTPVP